MSVFSLGSQYPNMPKNDSYWISKTAQVIGRVSINDNVSVWFGAVLRGDNELISIGCGTNIQENCVLHTDVGFPLSIGKNCTVGHGAILHGCSIGNNCIIGMGAVILNGATLGDNTIVGAGALVTEGKKYNDGKRLVLGSPARVIRELTSNELRAIKISAFEYQKKADTIKQSMKKIE